MVGITGRVVLIFQANSISRLQEETAKVEEHLLSNPSFSTAIVDCFLNSKADSFENFLEPLQKLLRLSPPIASSLAHPDLFSRTVLKLRTKKALVRLNLLRIIRSICDASDEDGALIRTYGLQDSITEAAKTDPAILVREMASDLLKSSELNASRAAHARNGLDAAAKLRPLRRSSSSTMIPANGSMPPTPSSDRGHGRAGSYFDPSVDLARSSARTVAGLSSATSSHASSPYRPISRDGNSGGSNTNWSAAGPAPSSGLGGATAKSRLPRTSTSGGGGGRSGGGSRLSIVPSSSVTRGGADKNENMTPTHAQGRLLGGQTVTPASAPTGYSRRRRQTSNG